jgi:biopolymer transport protein ExbB
MDVMRLVLVALCAACSFHDGVGANGTDAAAPDARVYLDAAPSTAMRVELTLHNAQRAEALLDFPVLVALDAGRIDYAHTAPGGADLRFFAADDATPLDYEIDTWMAGGRSAAWVRVPSIAANTDAHIWMHYGDPAATSQANPPAVWSSEHVVVWHLSQDPASGAANAIVDSTSRAHHGTATSLLDASRLGAGPIGSSLAFHTVANPGFECVLAAPSSDFTLPRYTWSAWLSGDSAPATGGGGNLEPLSNGDVGFNFAWNHNTAAYTAAAAQRDANLWAAISVGPSNVAAGTWYLVAATYDGTQLCSYLDGVQKGCAASGTPEAPNGSLSIGGPNVASGCTYGTFAGRIDEVRVTSSAQTPARLDAEYATQADLPASPFVTFGTPERVP